MPARMFSAGVRESEKSKSTRCSLSPRPSMPDRDVVGLDVAVRDALFFEMIDDVQQVFAEPLQQVHVQPALLAEPLAQGLDELPVLVGEDGPHQEADAVADLQRIERSSTMCWWRSLPCEHLGLVLDPRVVAPDHWPP